MTIYDLAWTEPAYQSDTLKSYLYVQYNDDDDLQAFVEAYNALSQEIITWLAEANLPVYTGAPITGALLDWVATSMICTCISVSSKAIAKLRLLC